MARKSILKVGTRFVAGVSAEHMCVQFTTDADAAKKFSSPAQAVAFMDAYSDAGYGFTRTTASIVPA